jgi:hypothetical protein
VTELPLSGLSISPARRSQRQAKTDAARLADALLMLGDNCTHEDEPFTPPHPWRTTLAGATLLLAPLLLGGLGVLSPLVTSLIALPLLALVGLYVALAWIDLWRARALADRLLRVHPAGPHAPLAAWRAEELNSAWAQHRRHGLRRDERLRTQPSSSFIDST